jgi:hypothetical protein
MITKILTACTRDWVYAMKWLGIPLIGNSLALPPVNKHPGPTGWIREQRIAAMLFNFAVRRIYQPMSSQLSLKDTISELRITPRSWHSPMTHER